jgi:hypothetical protein
MEIDIEPAYGRQRCRPFHGLANQLGTILGLAPQALFCHLGRFRAPYLGHLRRFCAQYLGHLRRLFNWLVSHRDLHGREDLLADSLLA